MLEDISDPFNHVANRPPRPFHSGARSSNEGIDARGLVVPIPTPSGPADVAGGVDGYRPTADSAPAPPITTAPGPGEVSSPRWWSKKPSHQS